MTFKPMLASPADFDTLVFPLYASPKLDGVRAVVVDGKLMSRSMKPIPNKFVSAALSKLTFDGLDGELIAGSATSPTVYRDTVSAVMRHEGEPEVTFHVFDVHDVRQDFHSRLAWLRDEVTGTAYVDLVANIKIVVHEHELINDLDELAAYEAKVVGLGYEGLILRSTAGVYKQGRSTAREQYMLKVKRFVDSEAEVIGIEEEMFNGNEAQTNELGRTKRSSAKAGLVGKGTMGALVVRDVKSGVEFNIGTGFTAADRAAAWPLGTLVKYKSFDIGVKDKPRHPVFLGIRSNLDL